MIWRSRPGWSPICGLTVGTPAPWRPDRRSVRCAVAPQQQMIECMPETAADPTGADLAGADLAGAALTAATFDAATRWPQGFDPRQLKAVLAE